MNDVLSLNVFCVEFFNIDCGAMVTIGVDKCVVVVVGATVGAVAIGGSVTGKNVDTFGDSGPYVYNACDGGPVEAVADAGIRM